MQPTYRVIETNEIGQLIPCPCDNPVILEFADGIRDAFHLREVEPTTAPISASKNRSHHARNGKNGRPPGIAKSTIKQMHQIHQFLMKQTQPVSRSEIEKAVGFYTVRCLMHQPSSKITTSLESLGIAKRIKAERTWLKWQLTQLGKERGEDLINSLK